MRIEIKFGGLGGQGIITMGFIFANAAAIYDGKECVFTQDYSAEARGGASTSEVIISDEKIDYPHVTKADYLVVMSQSAYRDYIDKLRNNGVLIIDSDMVKIEEEEKRKVYGIPATKIAENLGNTIVANIVMLGFFTGITKMLKKESVMNAIRDRVPKKFWDLNEKAFNRGYSHAMNMK